MIERVSGWHSTDNFLVFFVFVFKRKYLHDTTKAVGLIDCIGSNRAAKSVWYEELLKRTVMLGFLTKKYCPMFKQVFPLFIDFISTF